MRKILIVLIVGAAIAVMGAMSAAAMSTEECPSSSAGDQYCKEVVTSTVSKNPPSITYTDETSSGDSLPNTGFPLLGIVASSSAIVVLGLVIRRRRS